MTPLPLIQFLEGKITPQKYPWNNLRTFHQINLRMLSAYYTALQRYHRPLPPFERFKEQYIKKIKRSQSNQDAATHVVQVHRNILFLLPRSEAALKKQDRFLAWKNQTLSEAVKILHDNPDSLLPFLAQARQEFAESEHEPNCDFFGTLRSNTPHHLSRTPVYDTPFYNRLLPIADDFSLEWSHWIYSLEFRDFFSFVFEKGVSVRCSLYRIGSKIYQLTGYIKSGNEIDTDAYHQMMKTGTALPQMCLLHSRVEEMNELMPEIEKLLLEAIKTPLDLKQIAKLHWLFVHVMPYHRGSASIAELMIEAIFLSQGQKINWKVRPDMEAFCAPKLEEFVENYSSFFSYSNKKA